MGCRPTLDYQELRVWGSQTADRDYLELAEMVFIWRRDARPGLETVSIKLETGMTVGIWGKFTQGLTRYGYVHVYCMYIHTYIRIQESEPLGPG